MTALQPSRTATPNGVTPQIPSPRWRSYRAPEPVPQEFFESPRARAAMAARDVHTVFAVLGSMGVSQRRIAALAGQSQSEISEIRSGRRVKSVDVIERIADGLGTPRGWWGLAHTHGAVAPQPAVPEVDAPIVRVEPVAPVQSPAPAARSARAPTLADLHASSAELAAARHLIGLIRALAPLAPESVIRAARNRRSLRGSTLPGGRRRR
jgi:transcriptional regulator with XRE-family HTH domain